MNYGKIENGKFVGVGKTIRHENGIIINPSHEEYLAHGYLPSVRESAPAYDPDTEEIVEGEPYIANDVIHRTFARKRF